MAGGGGCGAILIPVGVFMCKWKAEIRVRGSPPSLSTLLLETGSPTETRTRQLARLAGQ